jgi:N-acetylmuramoyl-L-alanine amidase
MKIFIDPGHGGSDGGAAGGGLIEKAMNLVTAQALAEKLKENGVEVKLSRTDDRYLSLTQRCDLANSWGADLFVSVHYNAGGGDRGEVIHAVSGGPGKELALSIAAGLKKIGQSEVKTYARASTNNVNANYYTVIQGTKMPAVIVEGCFIDNEEDRKIADTAEEQQQIGYAVAAGVLDYLGVEENEESEVDNVAQTVMKLDNIWVQEIAPADFEIMRCDCAKRDISVSNYFNLGFFAGLKGGGTVPVGNLVIDGKAITQAKDNESWINVAGKTLTTVYTTAGGRCGIIHTDDMTALPEIKYAVSGIPIIVGGKYVDLDKIKAEGYFGDELYDTWHGFLGLRHNKLVYVAVKCGFDAMCWALVALGIYDAVKLDGGGSFILKNGREIVGTGENRRINNVGVWR